MSRRFLPSAIIFINTDLVDQVLATFVTQLFITQVMDAATFDSIIATDPNYPAEVHQDGYRILVLRDLWDLTNREIANMVLFAKAGLVSVETNKYGPPNITLPIDRVYLTALVNLQKYHDWWCLHPHGYEQAWDWEPTNNSDFNPRHLDCPINIEPVGDHGNKQINHIIEPFVDHDPFGNACHVHGCECGCGC